jgi:osmotically-inducible protein OsmY
MKTNYMKAIAIAASVMLLGNVSLSASEQDDRIETAAKESYTFKTYLKNDSVKVDAKDGVVVLKGTVNEASNKRLAEDTVENLPGVVRVDNRIKVRYEEPEKSDTWLATKIRSTLIFHRNVSSTKTGVEVADGVVTLRGEASNQAQKDLTEEYVRDVEGVKEVRNEIIVAQKEPGVTETIGAKIDDASITAQVKATLLAHRSTSALKTKVKTELGVVTVSGVAANEAEKSLVTKLVTDINGVVSVINNMTVSSVASK